jgi:ArsR family transcriptional regulator
MTLLSPTEVNISSCAPSGLAASLDRGQAEQLSSLLKAVADPTRLQLIAYINASTKSESCVCDLTEALDLSQPTISHHLRILTEAGLISREKRGTWVWYSVNQERWDELSNLFRSDSFSSAECC